MATIGPVAVGVTLAFAWNLAVPHPQHAAEGNSGVTREVGQTVQQAAQQAAQQAWARASHAPEGGAGGRQGTRQARSG